ncbi:MAG: hypothetical protein ACOX5J_12970 [Candidatus Hydrogenedentales bacterium]|jgi:hypothetical protein
MSEIIYECHGDGEVEVVLSFLAANGIRAVTTSLASRSVHPFTVDGMGKTSILVEKADAEQARRLLAERESLADGAGGEEA